MAFPDNVKYEIKVNDFDVIITTEDPPFINEQSISYNDRSLILTIDIFDFDKYMPTVGWNLLNFSLKDIGFDSIIDSEGQNPFRLKELWVNNTASYTEIAFKVEVLIKPNTTDEDNYTNLELQCNLLNLDPDHLLNVTLTLPFIPIKQLSAKTSPETAKITIEENSAEIPAIVDQCYALTAISPKFFNCVFENIYTTPTSYYCNVGVKTISGDIEFELLELNYTTPTSTSDTVTASINVCPTTNFSFNQRNAKILLWAQSPKTGNIIYSDIINIVQKSTILNKINLLEEYSFDYTAKSSVEIKVIVNNKNITEIKDVDIEDIDDVFYVEDWKYVQTNPYYNVLYIYLSMPEYKTQLSDPSDWDTITQNLIRLDRLVVEAYDDDSSETYVAYSVLKQIHLTEYTNVPSWSDMVCVITSSSETITNTDFKVMQDETEIYSGNVLPTHLFNTQYAGLVNVKDIIQNNLNILFVLNNNGQYVEDNQYKQFWVYSDGMPIYKINVYWNYAYQNVTRTPDLNETPFLNRCIFNKASRKQYIFASMISSMNAPSPMVLSAVSENEYGTESYLLSNITVNQEARLISVMANPDTSYVTFEFKPNRAPSSSYEFEKYEITDEKYDYCLYYLNLYGGWDWLLLNDASTMGDDKQTTQYEFDSFSADGLSNYNFNPIERRIYNTGNVVQHKWTVYTDLFLGDRIFYNYDKDGYDNYEKLNANEQSKLMKHVLLSPQLFLHDFSTNFIYAVNLTDSSMTYKTILSNGNKLFNYKLELTQAQKNNINY